MSGQGSSSSDTVVRVEVYLDGGSETVEVLTAPPFRFQLDTSSLEEGEHTLRLVRIDASGGKRERRVPFRVRHEPAVEVRGLEDGAVVSGRVDVDVVVPPAAVPPASPAAAPLRGPSPWLYIVSTVIVLGGIWVFFMLVPMYGAIVGSSSSKQATASTGGGSAPPVSQALLTSGEQLYTSDCASCHQPSGQGMPPTFPALAGNSFLSDPAAVVKRIYEGSGAMPSHHSYTATQLAAVATYIRNTWGNGFGGVTVDQAASAAPQASKGSGAGGASSSGAASASSTSGAAGSGAPSPSATSSAASSGGATPASSSSQAGAATSQAMEAGKKLYTADCQSCHQPNGSGLPPTFPALAGNSFLNDASNVVQRIYDGKGSMPSHPSYTAQDLANVATYIRGAFGNDYGPVSVQQAEQAAPKAAR